MHITRHIKKLLKTRPVLFATPGHMQAYHTMPEFGELFGKEVFKSDLAEIESMDNLQNPEGPILKSLQRAAKIYNTKSTFYLVNGSSSGIIALMLATVKKGDKVLIARNAHKSVINALILSGAVPVWAQIEWNEEWNIPGSAKIDSIPDDVKAVWLTSPTYEGVATDIKSIAFMCKQKGIPLIVDEAHGALWPFSDKLPDSAINCGADVCVQSLHKTGSCLNQGAVLLLFENSKIKPEEVQKALNIINTTSPSYVLLSSIESSIEYLNSNTGRKRLERLINNITDMKNRLKKYPDIKFLKNSDPTKIFFGVEGVCAQAVSDFMEQKFNIEVELNNEKGLLALTGIGTSEKNLKILEKVLIKAVKTLPKSYKKTLTIPYIAPIVSMSPAEAFNQKSMKIKPEKAVGKISKETIVKYPPGIPLVIAGEVIQEGHLGFLKNHREIEIVI